MAFCFGLLLPQPVLAGGTINVLGTNGAIIISGSPASKANGTDFGDLLVGASLTNTLSIRSLYKSDLGIIWTTNGANASAFTIAGIPALLHYVTTNFTVVYRPAASGSNTASLVIINNADFSTYTVKLAGLGVTPPVITTQPVSAVVGVGQPVSLSVSNDGAAPFSYQWLKDGVILTGRTNSTLAYASFQFTNSGSYYVVITNAYGLVISFPASLSVSNAPLRAWGNNSYGQLGNGTNGTGVYTNLPIQVTNNVVAVAGGGNHSLFVKSDGSLWAIGYNGKGQLGNGMNTDTNLPVQVTNGVVAAAGGYNHSLFVKTDGTLWAMGANDSGQLGNGMNGAGADTNLPIQVTNNVVAVAAGSSHSLFVKTDGSLWAMGYNIDGELGNGTYANTNRPVEVASNVVAIAAGYEHSLFMKADGTLWAMGCNDDGQLGNGTYNKTNLPIQVTNNVVAVASGSSHSLFVKTDGTLWAMGANTSGQLGNGTLTKTNLPIQATNNVAVVVAGYAHSLFVKADGTLWAMGNNVFGQLGNGTLTQSTVPVLVNNGGLMTASLAKEPFAYHSLAITEVPQPGMVILGTNGTTIVSGEAADAAKGTDFGTFTLGSAAVTNTFAITNCGEATLTISGVTTNGSSLFQCSSIPASIATGTAINFSVVFNPSAAGVATASIVIVNDSTNTPHVVNVKGTVNGAETNLLAPGGVSATDGTYTNMVQVTWLGVAGAMSYEILRNTTPDVNGATVLANVPAADALVLSRTASATTYHYDDTTVVGRLSYYYWVRALSGSGVSALSYVGMGYAELGSGQTVGCSDLTVSDMVFLPVNLTNGSPAGTVSYRLANGGSATLTAAPVRFDFYMVQSNQAAWMAYYETNVTLVAGAEQLIILDASARQWLRVRGDLAGRYTVQARVRHLDLIGDGHTGSNLTVAAGTVLVKASGVNSPGRALNDYDGDGKADVCVYQSALGRWYAKLSGDRYVTDPSIGDVGMGWTPVAGDYDGDGITDVAAYNRLSGQWLARFSSSGLLDDCWLGGPAFTAAQCDFDGDSKTDPLVYREADGYWIGAASTKQYALCYASLGETGYQPVVADYDGDGLADLAVYNRTTGLWVISLSGRGYQPLVIGTFGGSGYLPFAADYDGDGLADPAIYSPGTAHWQVLFSGSLATQGCYTWGDAVLATIGGIPVPADYDGDGKADLAVYHQDTSLWELYLSTQGYQLVWGLFGGPVYQPVTE